MRYIALLSTVAYFVSARVCPYSTASDQLTYQRNAVAIFPIEWTSGKPHLANCGFNLLNGNTESVVESEFPCGAGIDYDPSRLRIKIPQESGCNTADDGCVIEFYGYETTDPSETFGLCVNVILVDSAVDPRSNPSQFIIDTQTTIPTPAAPVLDLAAIAKAIKRWQNKMKIPNIN